MKKETVTVTVITSGPFYGEVEREYEDEFFVMNDMYLNEKVNIQVTNGLEEVIFEEEDIDSILDDYSYNIGHKFTVDSLYENAEYGVEYIVNQSYMCDIEVEKFDKSKLKLDTHMIGDTKSITLNGLKYDNTYYELELDHGTSYIDEISYEELEEVFMV